MPTKRGLILQARDRSEVKDLLELSQDACLDVLLEVDEVFAVPHFKNGDRESIAIDTENIKEYLVLAREYLSA